MKTMKGDLLALAGGDWDKIKVIIDEELGDADHTMVYL